MLDRPSKEPLSQTTLGQYKVRARIGSGGMGDVYDAMHTSLQKRVAIKTLRARFLEDETVVARFLREGQLASRIRHPNIVDVTDVGIIGGLPCLVMEHLEGESLSARIKRDGSMRIDELVDLLLPIVAAVDFAHEHGVLHRDIKPSNIFLSRSWNGEIVPKVLDFGISKLVHESVEAALTTDSAFVGTPQYASPELMRADKATDGRSDQYSMGIVLYEGVTGSRPFADKASNFVALAMAICAGELAPPRHIKPDVPEVFERVIMRSVALRPDERFGTMKELGEALLPFASERGRLIWAPTFKQARQPGDPVSRVDNTALLDLPAPPSGGSSTLAHAGAPGPSDAMTPGSGGIFVPSSLHAQTGPFLPSSGPMHAAGFPSGSMPPGSVPGQGHPPGGSFPPFSGPSQTPPGAAYDRTPSYGNGGVSTHGGVAGPPPARRSGLLIAALCVGAIVAGGGLLAVVKLRGPAAEPAGAAAGAGTVAAPPTGATAAGAASVAAPATGTFALRVATSPRTAEISIDGQVIGTGAATRSFPRDGASHILRVSAPGYLTRELPFTEAQLPPIMVDLAPLPAPPPVAHTAPVVHRPVRPPPPATTGKTPDNRPKTDNIDPWEK